MNSGRFREPTVISRLKDKQEYELWVLGYLKQNSLYKDNEGSNINVINEDGTIVAHLKILDRASDERAQEIIRNLTPLVFTSTYKLIDCIFEWILEIHHEEGIIDSVPWSFVGKINKIFELQESDELVLPQLFLEENQIYRIILSLYDKLRDFRNTIVHKRSFDISDNSLTITNRYNDSITISNNSLFSLSHSTVQISQLLQGMPMSVKVIRDIKSHLDVIRTIHGCSEFDVLKPSGIRYVTHPKRIVNIATNAIEWGVNMYPLWNSLEKRYGGNVEDFELQIIAKKFDDSLLSWLIPSESLQGYIFFTVSEENHSWNKFKMFIERDDFNSSTS